MSRRDLSAYAAEDVLYHMSALAGLAASLGQEAGLRRCVRLGEELERRGLGAREAASMHGVLADVWEGLRTLGHRDADRGPGEWEQEEAEQWLRHLRLALDRAALKRLPRERVARLLASLAAALSGVGRFPEAVECWDRALSVSPSFALARGRKGYALTHYAQALADPEQARVFARYAHAELKTALALDLYDEARGQFERRMGWIEEHYGDRALLGEVDLHAFSEGSSEAEVLYRRWCLQHRLFLNPLNDLGPYPFAARDAAHIPPLASRRTGGTYYHGFYNQMKQAFVTARFLYYDALHSEGPHFADRGVLLFDTMDYATYSLAAEKARAAFEMAHSLLGKTAVFLSRYYALGIQPERASLRTLWYLRGRREAGLRPEFAGSPNWPLRGLFWLSKDLAENAPGFDRSIEPEGRELAEILHHMRHQYLKLCDDPGRAGVSPPSFDTDLPPAELDEFVAYEVHRGEFEAKTLKLLKTVRSALMYLALAVHVEERGRLRHATGPDAHAIALDPIDDGMKR